MKLTWKNDYFIQALKWKKQIKRGGIELMCIAQDFRKLEMRENWLKEGQKDYAISTSFFHEENIDTRIRDICGSIFFRYYSYQLHNLKTKSSNILTKLRLHGIGRRNKVLKHGFS